MKPIASNTVLLSVSRVRVEGMAYTQIVTLNGEIDLETVGELRRHFQEAQADGVSEMVLDLENVGFIDSVGLSTLADASRRLRTAGGWLRVVSTRQNLRRLLDITGLIRFLPIFSDVTSALA